MKILYLTSLEINDFNGVSKKILSQIKSFENKGYEVILCDIKQKGNFLYQEIYQKNIYLKKIINNILGRQYFLYSYNKILSYVVKENIDIVYIRYACNASPSFINFLKKLKKIKKKILLEIATYPYDNEILETVNPLKKIKYKIEKKYRLFLKNYIDRIITFSNDNEIFGVKTIKISNGIDIDRISLVNRKNKKLENEINFLGVAQLAFWHGFDRFILSMSEYYKNNPIKIVKFHVVGDGDKKVVEKLKKLVKDCNLENYVIFYGFKSGKDLDDIYNQTDIAIGSLGIHRLNLEEVQPLKNREYCAKGLPFVISFKDLWFEDKKFVFKVSNDEELFDINEIISWYKNLKISPEEIREYSKQFTWNIQMGKVVECLEDIN